MVLAALLVVIDGDRHPGILNFNHHNGSFSYQNGIDFVCADMLVITLLLVFVVRHDEVCKQTGVSRAHQNRRYAESRRMSRYSA